MPKVKDLTVKQRKFLHELTITLSPTEAAFRAYNCKDRNSAKSIAYENLTKLNISMNELMDKMGLTIEEDLNDLKRLRKAKRLQTCDIYVTNEETGKVTFNKNSNDFIEVDDNQTQLKALELTLRLKGKLKEFTNEGNKLQVFIGDKFSRWVDDIESKQVRSSVKAE